MTVSCLTSATCRQGSQSGSSKQPEGSWAHEQYEEDAAFSKYTARLQRSPGQCLRLCASGSVLWPRKELPVAPRYSVLLLDCAFHVLLLTSAALCLHGIYGLELLLTDMVARCPHATWPSLQQGLIKCDPE